jgi:hypothetical protein
MKFVSKYSTRLSASSEKRRFQGIVGALVCVVFSISAIVTFSIAIQGLSQGFPYVASIGLLIFSLVLIILAVAIARVSRLWPR